MFAGMPAQWERQHIYVCQGTLGVHAPVNSKHIKTIFTLT